MCWKPHVITAGHNKPEAADVRQLNCRVPCSFGAHLLVAQSSGRNKLTWAIADLPKISTKIFFFLQQFCISLIFKLSMLLKRRASHNFPYLSMVGKATTGQSVGLERLDPPKLTPHPPSSDPDWRGEERVGRDVPSSSQIQTAYSHRALRLRAVVGMRQDSKN